MAFLSMEMIREIQTIAAAHAARERVRMGTPPVRDVAKTKDESSAGVKDGGRT